MKGTSEILNRLFGSVNRVKVLRFFISNSETGYTFRELAARLNLSQEILRKETSSLKKLNFIKSAKKDKNEKLFLNSSFLFLKPLKNLILSASPVSKNDLIEKLKKIGRCKLVVLSGNLIQDDNDSKIDLLIVGDNLSRSSFTKILKNIEADLGREISYVLMSQKDFRYRLDIRDKFVREILESPREIILDKLKIF